MATSQLFHENYYCKILPCPPACAAQGHLWDPPNDRATLEEALSCWQCIWWSLLKRVWASSRLWKVAGGENQMQGLPTPERSTPAGDKYVISLLIGHVGGVLGTCQHEDEDGVWRSLLCVVSSATPFSQKGGVSVWEDDWLLSEAMQPRKGWKTQPLNHGRCSSSIIFPVV